MKIIKRNGAEAEFDIEKIVVAISKANDAVEEKARMTPLQIRRIAESVRLSCEELGRSPSVEEIQDLVEKAIMAHGAFEVAKCYITYRYTRSLLRQSNTTDERILSLIECNNEEVKQENANKNPTINAVQRDYMAGEVSKDITRRILLPQDIVAAHEAGHALQDARGYVPLRFRVAIVPVCNVGSRLAMPLFFIGLLLAGAGAFSEYLMLAGIAAFSLSVFFQLVTLPVEFNASRRAMRCLTSSGTMSDEQLKGSRKVLTAAAMTYVAALAVGLLSLLRLLLIAASYNSRRNR